MAKQIRPIVASSMALVVLIALVVALTGRAAPVNANATYQTLPFTQNWSITTSITTNDDWSGVPGIVGYLGDFFPSSTTAIPDPRTIVSDITGVSVDVIANQTNPNTLTTGGVAEFDTLANPVVALQGSGTADAPFILLHLDTTGRTSVTVAYNLRDIDGSADNAVQAVALQYRIGTTGNFTNVAAGFVADATTGPSLATLVTPVTATLPADADNQSQVQVRIMTSNAVGSDEWVGVDDISVTGTALVIVPEADLAINKSGPGVASPADTITYTISLSNTGNITATSTIVTDTLPLEVNFVTYTTSLANNFSQSGNMLVWQLGDVLSQTTGLTISVQVTVSTGVPVPTLIANNVNATTTATETVTANNTASVTTTIRQADLTVGKTGPSVVMPGNRITYTVSVSNTGYPGTADLIVTDTLPSYVTYVTDTTGVSPTAASPGVYVWALPGVAAGGTYSFNLVVDLSSGAPFGTLTNTVDVATMSTEEHTNNNSAQWVVTVGGTDLVISKQVPLTAAPGEMITFTLNAANTGSIPASNVWLTDTLPTQTSYITDSLGGNVGQSGQEYGWFLNSLAPGNGITFTVVVTVSPNAHANDVLVNTARLSGAEAEQDLANNITTTTTTINGVDPFVIKTGPTVSFGGEVVSATITYGNHGNQAAPVTITDLLPIGFTTADIAADTSGLPFVNDANSRAWTTTVGANSSFSFTLALTVPTTIANATRVTNTVAITSTGAGNNPIDDVSILAGPVYQIVPITNARTGAIGQIFAIDGRVTYIPGTYNADGWGVQDNSGGIAVFYTPHPTITLGDRVRLVATRGLNGVEKQLTSPVYYFANLGSGPQVDPTPFSTGAVVSGTADGWLAVISGTVSGLGACTSNYSFNVNDGSGVTTVFVDLDTTINVCNMGIANGDAVRVVGFGTLFGTLYEIKPRFPADVIEYPRVLSTNPSNGATDVPITSTINATFNITMTNVNTATFLVNSASGAVAGTVVFDAAAKLATFTPSASLAFGTRYTATLNAALQADNGLPLFPTQDVVWSFTTYQPTPNLSIAKSVATPHTPALPGDVITYTITLTNSGDANAAGVVMTDGLPAEVMFGGFVNTPPAGTVRVGNAITWTGTLTPATTIGWVLTATVDTNTNVYGHSVTNVAAFVSTNAGSNTASANFNIITGPDLTTSTKVASLTGRVRPGDLVTYTITLSNTGGTNAAVHVDDLIASFYTVYDALDFTPQVLTGTLGWTGVVTAGQGVTLRFVAQVQNFSWFPMGVTNLSNFMRIHDGVHTPFLIPSSNVPYVQVYGTFLPLVKRSNSS